MNKFKIALTLVILCILISGITCGAAYATWIYDDDLIVNKNIGFMVPEWNFDEDTDFALRGNIQDTNCAYLVPTQETSIVRGSAEAVRLTNTAGTQGKTHSFMVDLDRDYTVGEIKIQKVSFDYYYASKRQQQGKGFPKVQLFYYNPANSTYQKVGNNYGGGETVATLSPFTVTNIDEGWWHLEYFITALAPTFGDHGDTVISETQIVNAIKISDDYIYDFNSTTAFIVIDNLKFSSAASTKLGLFNGTNSFKVGKYYWMKVAWAGEVHSVVITFSDDGSDDPVCVYTPSAKSPFYIKGLRTGTVVITCTMVVGDEHQVLSISNTITVT